MRLSLFLRSGSFLLYEVCEDGVVDGEAVDGVELLD
jgi:hypothetical protein